MSDQVTIEIDAVRAAIAVLLGALHESFGPSVAVPADGYWHLPVKSAFDLSKPPGDLTVGRLGDDVDELGEIIADPSSAATSAWHGLAHVIGILRRPGTGRSSVGAGHSARSGRCARSGLSLVASCQGQGAGYLDRK
jgi:hypothetical protein